MATGASRVAPGGVPSRPSGGRKGGKGRATVGTLADRDRADDGAPEGARYRRYRRGEKGAVSSTGATPQLEDPRDGATARAGMRAHAWEGGDASAAGSLGRPAGDPTDQGVTRFGIRRTAPATTSGGATKGGATPIRLSAPFAASSYGRVGRAIRGVFRQARRVR